MSNTNIISPLFDAIWDVGKLLYRLITGTNKRFNFDEFFKICSVKNSKEEYAQLYKEIDLEERKKYLVTIPTGLSLKDFTKHQEALEIKLGSKVEMYIDNEFLSIETVVDTLPNKVQYNIPKLQDISKGIVIPIGVNSKKEIISISLMEHPHSIVAGATGSGKSVCLKALMVSIITNYKPDDIEVYIGDLKYVEFALFKNASIINKFVTSVEDVTDMIQDLLDETERRYQLFEQVGVTNIFDYNKKFPNKKLKFQVLLVEEIVNLLQDKKKRAMKLLKRLISISRSSGLYCIFSTQRPSVDVIDSVVKANISNRIIFHTESKKDSVICLDSLGAETLDVKGRGILKVGSNKEVFQGYFIDDEDVVKYIKPYLKPRETANKSNNIKELNKIDKTDKIKNSVKANEEVDLSFLDKI